MTEASIKGTTFDSVLQDVRSLLATKHLSRDALEARLAPADRALLDTKIQPANWYPIACYAALLEQLCEVEGKADPHEYLRRRGAIAAERLHATGIYPQLDASGAKLGLRVLPLVISLASSIYNFMKWSTDIDASGRGFRVHVEGTDAYPEVARFAAEGFLLWTTERVMEMRARVTSERPSPDRVVFHGELVRP